MCIRYIKINHAGVAAVVGDQSSPGTSARGRVQTTWSSALNVELDDWSRWCGMSEGVRGIVAWHDSHQDVGRKPSGRDIDGRRTRRHTSDVYDTGMHIWIANIVGLFVGWQPVRAAHRQTVVQLTHPERRHFVSRWIAIAVRKPHRFEASVDRRLFLSWWRHYVRLAGV